MANIALQSELLNDPANLGLAKLDAAAVADLLNSPSMIMTKGPCNAYNLLTAVTSGDFARLTPEQSLACVALMANPSQQIPADMLDRLKKLFPDDTLYSRVLSLLTYTVSRASFVGIGTVSAKDIDDTRTPDLGLSPKGG